jgi:hypothetical protein
MRANFLRHAPNRFLRSSSTMLTPILTNTQVAIANTPLLKIRSHFPLARRPYGRIGRLAISLRRSMFIGATR